MTFTNFRSTRITNTLFFALVGVTFIILVLGPGIFFWITWTKEIAEFALPDRSATLTTLLKHSQIAPHSLVSVRGSVFKTMDVTNDVLGDVSTDKTWSLGVSGDVEVRDEGGWVRIIAHEKENEYVVFEAAQPWPAEKFSVEYFCQETCLFELPKHIDAISIEGDGISFHATEISFYRRSGILPNLIGNNTIQRKREKISLQQRLMRVHDLNMALERDDRPWVACDTEIARHEFNVRRRLYGLLATKIPNFAYYCGGYFDSASAKILSNPTLQREATGKIKPGFFSGTHVHRRPLDRSDGSVGKPFVLLRLSSVTDWGVGGYMKLIVADTEMSMLSQDFTVLFTAPPAPVKDVMARVDESPVFTIGTPGKWDDAVVYRPRLARNPDGTPFQDSNRGYYMYYNASGGELGRDIDQIGLAFSLDLLFWERQNLDRPVLPIGSHGSLDASDAQIGTVIVENGIFHAWYDGNGADFESEDDVSLGYAHSTDGILWEKNNNPILAKAADDGEDQYQPIVLRDGAVWKMWYMSKNHIGQIGISYATARKPEGPWKKHSEGFVFYPGYDIFASEIWKEEDLYVMAFYNTNGNLGATSLAKSNDGIIWKTSGVSLLFGQPNSWDGRSATDSESVFTNGAWWTLYTGSDGKSYSIGLAKSKSHYPLLIHENEWIWSDVDMVASSSH